MAGVSWDPQQLTGSPRRGLEVFMFMSSYNTLHYGKSSGTRRTFTLEAKISSFVGVLGVHLQFDRDLKMCRPYKKGLWSNQECEKRPIEKHEGSVRLVSHSALVPGVCREL